MNHKRIYMRYRILLSIILLGLLMPAFAQVNGDLTQFAEKKILRVWGTHYQRGYAQGFYLAPQIKDVFQDFFWTMFCFSNLPYYEMLHGYYSQNFVADTRMNSEAQGIIDGILASGTTLYHAGLGRDIGYEDLLMLNAVYDLVDVLDKSGMAPQVELGCASLSSWGNATSSDPILSGSSVITRFLDVSPNSAFINNPLIVVHYPSETDEQKWINFTMPGFFGAITAISESKVFASMNTGAEHAASSINNLSPILFDLRHGIERIDLDNNGISHPLDIFTSIGMYNNHSANMIHTLWESEGNVYTSVIERKNNVIANRLASQNGSLPSHHLAVTNHFRLISNNTCCSRYANIQDSLWTNAMLDAKRQWKVLAGAAGLESNLLAVQFTPSTGAIIWATATLTEPAHSRPGFNLSTEYLFTNTVSNSDVVAVVPEARISLYPNPISHGMKLSVKSNEALKQIEIFNIKGQKIGSYTADAKASEHHLPAFNIGSPKGIYLLKATTQKANISTHKIVLK